MSDTMFTVEKEKLDITTSRVFHATPERLWQAMTDNEQIPKWWGPAIYKVTVDKNELRAGGAWRLITSDGEGAEAAFSGEYIEIDEPHKVVRTFEFEPMPGHVLTETMILEPLEDGTTRMTATAHYASIEDLEGMVASGMEGGQRESYDRLAAFVER